MKKFIIFLFIPFSVQAGSRLLDILENQDSSSALQKELKRDVGSLFLSSKKPLDFIQAFEEKNFQKALHLWLNSVQKTSFSASPSGSALFSYLLFKNGFEVLALQKLFQISEPKKINSIVEKLWKTDIDKKHPVWDYFFFPVSQKWYGFFDENTFLKINSKYTFHLKKDEQHIRSLLSLPFNDTVDIFSLEWLIVLSLIKNSDMSSATKILTWLLKKTEDEIKRDRIYLTIGRLLANIGETKASIHYYSKVNQLSYFWLLAQEEKAWVSFYAGDYAHAYSTASAFEYLAFKKEISPSMFFIMALSQLKNCDYKGAVRSLYDFKSLFSKRRLEIKKMLSSKSYSALRDSLMAFYESGDSYYGLGSPELAYQFKKNKFLKNHIRLNNYMASRKKPEKVQFKFLIREQDKVKNQLESSIRDKIQSLLIKSADEIDFSLKNFQIIEAEILYRVHGFHFLASNKTKKTSVEFSSPALSSFFFPNDTLYFPFDSKEIWLDEVKNYKSNFLQNCPKESYVL